MVGRSGFGQITGTCNPSTDPYCDFACYWSQAPSCSADLTTRLAHGATLSWYCSLPGASTTFPTTCAAALPPPPPTPGPQTQVQMTVPGAWTPDQAIAAQAQAQKQTYSDFFGQLASQSAYQPASVDCCSLTGQLASGVCQASDLLGCSGFWMIAAGGVAVLLLLTRR
jgi:hypothetical protein